MKKTLCILLAVLVFCLFCAPVFAAETEQVQVDLPLIDLYFYEDTTDLSEIPAASVRAALNGKPLTVQRLERAQQGIFYVFLLDISASMPDGHFSAAKQAVLDTYDRLRSQDRLALISFGSEVRLMLAGGESRDAVSAALDGLQNADQNTMFYTAMGELISFLGETSEMRRVGIVVSDGMDDTDAGLTQEELEAALQQSGISVSALCISTASQENADSFRALIERSGGALYLFDGDTAAETLNTLLTRLGGGYHLQFSAPDAEANGLSQELTVDFGQGTVLTASVTLPLAETTAETAQPTAVPESAAVTEAATAPPETAAPLPPEAPAISTGTLILIGASALVILAAIFVILRLSRGPKKPQAKKAPREKRRPRVKSAATFVFLSKDSPDDSPDKKTPS